MHFIFDVHCLPYLPIRSLSYDATQLVFIGYLLDTSQCFYVVVLKHVLEVVFVVALNG